MLTLMTGRPGKMLVCKTICEPYQKPKNKVTIKIPKTMVWKDSFFQRRLMVSVKVYLPLKVESVGCFKTCCLKGTLLVAPRTG